MAKPSKQQQIQQPQVGQRSHPPEAVIVKLLVSFVVAFKRIGVFLPILAAAMTLLFYFFYPQLLLSWQQQEKQLGGFFIMSDGLLCALLIALVYALCSMPVVALTNRGLQDYAFFKMSEEQLCARLGKPVSESGTAATPQEEMAEHIDFLSLRQDSQKLAVYREACNTYFNLQETLYSPKAVQLLSNAGDVDALAMVHRVQEALLKIEAIPGVIEEAKQVYEALQASSIPHPDELLKELAQAISILDPQPAEGLHEEKRNKLFDSLRKKIRKRHKALGVTTNISHPSLPPAQEGQIDDLKTTGNGLPVLETEVRMRAIIHFISMSLHRFQEDRLAEILQARNNLMLAILASGLITYALLCVSIVAILQYLPDPSTTSPTDFQSATAPVTSALASAMVIYTTGVAAGLFGRLYAEANKESAAKDYGLSRVRLQAVPLISGLAAIGGVFITTAALATTASAVVMSAFTLNVRTILVAMIFGFTPNLLIRGFQRHSDQYTSDLESTKEK